MYKDGDDLALWAHRRLPAKSTLTANDARAVEAAYQAILNGVYRMPRVSPARFPIRRWNRDRPAQITEPRSSKIRRLTVN
jgi:hypothetical protein